MSEGDGGDVLAESQFFSILLICFVFVDSMRETAISSKLLYANVIHVVLQNSRPGIKMAIS